MIQFCFCVLMAFILALVMSGAPVANLMRLEFLGEVNWLTGTEFFQTEFGGLSGITYDQQKQVYYVISDDRGERAPARFYTLKIDLSQNRLTSENVSVISQTTLLTETGETFPPLSLDLEGIAVTDESIFVASEGDVARQINPVILEVSPEGQVVGSLPIPDKFLPGENWGVRNNLALESLAITPDQQYLFTANENALVQDGPVATLEAGSPCRIIRYDLNTRHPQQEFLYITDPIATPPTSERGFQTNGLVDLIALDAEHLISLERSFTMGVGNTIKLFEVSLVGADDIADLDAIANHLETIKPVTKKLISNLDQFNLFLDNLEGLTLGPKFSDGLFPLLLVSDNNFNPLQITQLLGFRVSIISN